jgi:hypothetical protein
MEAASIPAARRKKPRTQPHSGAASPVYTDQGSPDAQEAHMRLPALLLAALLAGCAAPLPLTPADVQARRMEAPPPGMGVIYLVRAHPEHNVHPAPLSLGDKQMITTYPGTYYRWEVPPGRHQIMGAFADNGEITVQVEAGRTYYVQQWTDPWITYAKSFFQPVSEAQARAIISRGVLVGG